MLKAASSICPAQIELAKCKFPVTNSAQDLNRSLTGSCRILMQYPNKILCKILWDPNDIL